MGRLLLGQSRRPWVGAIAAVMLLSGCGDDGKNGADGAAGPPGDPGVGVTAEATALSFALDGITIASPPVVDFTMTNEHGVRFIGLAQGQIRFTLAKLVPGTNGNPDAWQSYINRTETKGAGAWGAGGTAIQATSESNGTLVNNMDGTYRYTFANDVTSMTTPLAVSWQPTLTHRLGVQISGGGLPVANATYDWRPSDGATTGLLERDIVQTSSCNECHGKLALHGGGRIEAKYCVTCHNPGSKDANSGNTVDFKVMIHKIHRGESLPSVAAGGVYAIWGFNDTKADFSEVAYPQDIRNCTKCHDAADAATPQGGHWQTGMSVEACGSCHDDVNFATGQGHTSGNIVAQNGECTICHSESAGFAPTPAQAHVIPSKVESAKYAYAIVSATSTAPGQFPVVTYKVTNPATGAAYNIKDAGNPVFACVTGNKTSACNFGTVTNGGASRLAIDIGWSTADNTNKCAPGDMGTTACQTATSATAAPASAISLDALSASTNNNAAPVDNGDGTFTVTSLRPIPADAIGSGTLAFEGHPAADFDGDGHYTDRVPVKGVVLYKAITDASAVARRTVVDIAKCDKCHDQLSLHGNNRTDEPQLCALCHNANNTDIGRRGGTTGIDGLAEQSIDFKYMVHAIHGAEHRTNPYVVYGFGGSVNDFSKVLYPGILNNCATCHASTTFEPPLRPEVLATTVRSGASRPDPSDDTNITPTAAVCSSCHETNVAQTHMEQNGASFVMSGDPGAYSETCEVCHGPGRIADVSEVHRVTP